MATKSDMKTGSFQSSVVTASDNVDRENMLTPVGLANSQFRLHGLYSFNSGLEALPHGDNLDLIISQFVQHVAHVLHVLPFLSGNSILSVPKEGRGARRDADDRKRYA